MVAINQEQQNLREVFAMHVHFVWLLGYLKENKNNIGCKTILIDSNMNSPFTDGKKLFIFLFARIVLQLMLFVLLLPVWCRMWDMKFDFISSSLSLFTLFCIHVDAYTCLFTIRDTCCVT